LLFCSLVTNVVLFGGIERVQAANTASGSSADCNKINTNVSAATPASTVAQPAIPTKNPVIPLLINELLPDPEGSDSDNEWVEIKNPSDREAILDGWTLDDGEGGSKPYKLDGKKVAPESFLVISSKDSGIALNNDKDDVRLFSYEGIIIDQAHYDKTETGKAVARKSDNTWTVSSLLTPGEENKFPTAPMQPTTTEQSNTTANASATQAVQTTQTTTFKDGDISDEIEITEVLPNPAGQDKNNEWIELHNASDETVNLGNWKIQTQGKTFVIPDSFSLAPGEYFSFTYKDLRLTLKNSKNEINLIDPEGSTLDTINYNDAPEGVSFAKITIKDETEKRNENAFGGVAHAAENIQQEQWQWTGETSRNKKNPVYEKITGTIMDVADQSLTIQNRESKNQTLYFDEKTINSHLAKNIFTKGKNIIVTAEQAKDGKYAIKGYEIEKTASREEGEENREENKTDPEGVNPWLIFMIVAGGIIFWNKKIIAKIRSAVASKRKTLYTE
jgi:hypothetical protein